MVGVGKPHGLESRQNEQGDHCRHQESRREWGAHLESRGERAVRGPVGSVAHCGKYQWSRVGPPKRRSSSLLLGTPVKLEAKTFKNHFRNHRYLLNPPESLGRGAAQLLVGGGEGGPAKAHTGADHLAPAKAVLVLPCPSSVIRLIPESSGVKILICGTSNLAALAAMMHSRKWIYTCSLCLPNTRMLRLITATLRSGAPVSGSAL